MKAKNFRFIPLFLWPKIIKYYLFRILHLPISAVESNWIYFLRIANLEAVKIYKEPGNFIIYNEAFNHRVKIRAGNSSDILVYIQIFFHGEYQPLIKTLGSGKNLVIIDAGSNVGFFALYANFFAPFSSIYCIEPNEQNCSQIKAQQQLNNLENLRVEQSALWYENTSLDLISRLDNLEWNYSVVENANGLIKAITLFDLLDKYSIEKIDVFKMDIEGAETKLFEDPDFVRLVSDKVKVIAIETHDELGRDSIIGTLKSNHFSVDLKGELLFAKKM